MDEPQELQHDKHWRMAVWALGSAARLEPAFSLARSIASRRLRAPSLRIAELR
jgi:hypothetical protein